VIVDAHVHIFRSHAEDPERPVDEIARTEREAPLALLDRTLSEAKVDGAVLVPLGSEQEYVTSIVALNHHRFRAILGLPSPSPAVPQDTRAGHVSDSITRRLQSPGVRGLRLFALPESEDDPPPWLGVLRTLASSGQVLWMYPRPQDLPLLRATLETLPELRVVLNHTGFTQRGIGCDEHGRPRIRSKVPQPELQEVLELSRFPEVAVMVSGQYAFSRQAYPYLDIAPITQQVAERFGVERLVWASDFPWIIDKPGYRACLDLLDHQLPGLSTAERGAVLGGNVRRILDWSDA